MMKSHTIPTKRATDSATTGKHIRVRLMQHLLRNGLKAIYKLTPHCSCAVPRIQAYLARKRLWIIHFSCSSSLVPYVCKSFLCGREEKGGCIAVRIPVHINDVDSARHYHHIARGKVAAKNLEWISVDSINADRLSHSIIYHHSV